MNPIHRRCAILSREETAGDITWPRVSDRESEEETHCTSLNATSLQVSVVHISVGGGSMRSHSRGGVKLSDRTPCMP